jgi:hypothetical protein
MKKNRIQLQKSNIEFNENSKQPGIRNELDSRKNQEQDFKGDDVTHDKKPAHHRPKVNRTVK